MATTNLDPQLLQEVVNLLVSHMTTDAERRAILRSALPDKVYRRIDFHGSPHVFTMNMVNTLLEFGEVETGKPAIIALLDVINDGVGVDKQRAIGSIQQKLTPYFRPACPHCGVANRPTATFCTACGQRLPVALSPAPELIRRHWPVSSRMMISILIPLVMAGTIWGVWSTITGKPALDLTPTPPTQVAVSSPGATASIVPVDGVYHTKVNAREAYLKAADICGQAGDIVTVKAEGLIKVGTWVGDGGYVGPEGTERGAFSRPVGNDYDLVAALPHSVLMFRIVGEMTWRSYADPTARTFTAPVAGCLEFQLNDNDPGNNNETDFLEVTVSITSS